MVGIDDRPDEWPVTFEEWEASAASKLPRRAFDYVAGGAGDESTIRANREAFGRWRLRPRMLTGHATRDLGVSILGTPSPAPFFLAPIGVQGILHPEGEIAVARAAARHRIPMVVSSAASFSMEDIAAALGDTPRWFQLYWVTDRDVVKSFVDRAEVSGYSAVVVTVDTLTLGWRPRDLRNLYLPFLEGDGIGQFTSDPVFRSRLEKSPEEDLRAAGEAMVSMFPNLGLSWEDLAWLREQTALPILIKGILTAEDAQRAIGEGMDGVVVSNHGGRQVEGSVAALDALVEVRGALGPDALVLMDGGIRSGSDVCKALGLGADAVLLGRPYVYGLAVAGEEGVDRVLASFLSEIDTTFALLGAPNVRSVDPTFVTLA